MAEISMEIVYYLCLCDLHRMERMECEAEKDIRRI